MGWFAGLPPRQRRWYFTFIGIIALTIPCYCLGNYRAGDSAYHPIGHLDHAGRYSHGDADAGAPPPPCLPP